jgi:hypothetical protein
MMTDEPRDAANWAAKVDRLHVADEVRAVGYNIEGRRVAGPQQGFGRLWQRTTTADLGPGLTARRLVADWRAHFADYWPAGARFHGGGAGIAPGDVAPLRTGPVTTGILVLYADEESFTFMTPEGHMFAGMITFSAEDTDTGVRARIDILLRTADPLVEAAWFLIRPTEDRFWASTVRNLAVAHGVAQPTITQTTECIDSRRLWRHWRNVFRNPGIRSAWHDASSAVRRRPR